MKDNRKEDEVRNLGEINERLGKVEGDVGEVKSDVGEVKSEMGEVKSEIKVLSTRLNHVETYLKDIRDDVRGLYSLILRLFIPLTFAVIFGLAGLFLTIIFKK